ncbi:N-acetylmuramoyl-L-alanine amidase [Bacillus sp. JJ1533]|uniref:N-acetylmuramoyl-L-alanine amidase n=1 Tax=Bacillus sp. JJ1533 TaxID=3122959 RepID=UPI002FFE9F98
MSWIQDAGHGGVDPGAVSHGNTEKIYTLEAALYVNKRLADHGISSDLTRTNDVTVGPNQRTAKVRKYRKCISHHFNAGGGAGAEFIHSIYADGKFEAILRDEFKKAGYPVRRTFIRKLDSGQDYYYMHRETGNCRTTILEYEFIDGANSEKIKNQAYRQGMYECAVRAICRDEGVTYKPLKPKKEEDDDMLEKAILVGGLADMPFAEVLASRLKAPIYTRDAYPGGKVAKELYIVGGSTTGLQADKIIDLSGKNRLESARKVEEFLY